MTDSAVKKIPTIDLDRLQIFIHAAETLNFSRTAKILHLSQSTVSHHIKTLESDLGVVLFDRNSSALRLTEAGRLLLPLGRKLLNQSFQVQEMMASMQAEIAGHLRIACSTTSGKYILPQLAARFRQHYPGIRISIPSCTSPQIALRLLEGEANLGVISSELYDSELETQEFFIDSIVLIAPPDHPFATRKAIRPAELLDEPILMREPTSGTRRVMLSALAMHDINIDDLNIYLELGNTEAITFTVSQGYGIAFVSRLAANCLHSQKRIAIIPIEGIDLERKIYMVRRKIDAPNRLQEAFWSYVHNANNSDLLDLPSQGA